MHYLNKSIESIEGEIWRPTYISSKYEVSNLGRVKSIYFNKIISQIRDKSGYLEVRIRINKKDIRRTVHRLVAFAFHENPENKKEINHKDCNKLNNISTNVEWCTYEENRNHAIANGRMNLVSTTLTKDGFTKSFTTISEAANFIDVGYMKLYYRINSHKPIKGYYVTSDMMPKKELPEVYEKSISVMRTGTIINFKNEVECAKYFGVLVPVIRRNKNTYSLYRKSFIFDTHIIKKPNMVGTR